MHMPQTFSSISIYPHLVYILLLLQCNGKLFSLKLDFIFAAWRSEVRFFLSKIERKQTFALVLPRFLSFEKRGTF